MPCRTRLSRPTVYCTIGLLVVGVVAAGVVWWQVRSAVNKLPNGASSARYQPIERPSPPADDYVGGEACRRCHQAIWARYQSHPMSRSSEAIGTAASVDAATLAASATASVAAATPLEDFDRHPSFTVSTPIGEMEYRVESSPDGQFHHESLADSAYGPIYDQRVQVSYAIGSGSRGRSYVLVKNDCLFMSPISWYSQGTKWDLSPDYPPGNHPRFERRILQGCLACHTDRVSVNRDEPHQFSAPAILEAKIGCERCHGPGAGHIAFQERRSKSAEQTSTAVDPIVNPVKLDSERRESVCWQCHFSAEERVLRYGRLDSDFRPGMNFDDIWVAFVRGTRIDQNGSMLAVSQVEQTQSSMCFQRSEGRFGCLSCHDPHFAPAEHEKVKFYREKCLACHADRGCALPVEERTLVTEADSCVACHMPPRGLTSVPHTAQADHRVLRRPRPQSPSSLDVPLAIFNSGGRALPQVEEDRAWGLALAKTAYLMQDVEIARKAKGKLKSVQSYVPDDTHVLEWLGVCEQLMGRFEVARSHWLEILKRHPRDEAALRRLADLSLSVPQPDLPVARDALVRYLDVNPWQSKYQVRLAAIYGSLGNLEAADRCAKEALEVNPSSADAHGILVEVDKQRGNQADARRHKRWYHRLDPPK